MESSLHMCDVATECMLVNGYSQECTVIHKDVRRVKISKDAGDAGLAGPADICIFEVHKACLCSRHTKSAPAAVPTQSQIIKQQRDPLNELIHRGSHQILPVSLLVHHICESSYQALSNGSDGHQ